MSDKKLSKKKDPSHELAKSVGWHCESSDLIYESKWYDVRQDKILLHGKDRITYTYIDHPGFVTIVPVTSDNEIVLMKSFRYPSDEWCWEVPAGGLGDKPNAESIEEVAREELQEEIGGYCKTLTPLGTYLVSNGIAKIKQHIFVARDVEIRKSAPEVGEEIGEIKKVSIQEAEDLVCDGTINDAESAFAITLAIKAIATK